jgi:hypothetical protein
MGLSRVFGEDEGALHAKPCGTQARAEGFAVADRLRDDRVLVADGMQGSDVVLLEGLPRILAGLVEVFNVL